ncbi:hypothetical protein AAG570_012223 [Ranatra chinensis]|uniref:Uncharacterized protein n=1 Tax=Ranatra chinensis TaxID=642074 RepID=A0ABD0YIB9_9HEMI
MASKRRNVFHKNKRQETTGIEQIARVTSYKDSTLIKAYDGVQAIFYQNKKQETTEIGLTSDVGRKTNYMREEGTGWGTKRAARNPSKVSRSRGKHRGIRPSLCQTPEGIHSLLAYLKSGYTTEIYVVYGSRD